MKSNRVCPGYKDGSELKFRYYDTNKKLDVRNDADQDVRQKDINTFNTQFKHSQVELDDAQIEQRSLMTFFNDYCERSKDRSVSRGFLDGLETIIVYAGQSSNVAKAAKIVALAGIGNRLLRKTLVQKAERLYCELLSSFQKRLSEKTLCNTVELLVTASLIGLYEVGKSKTPELQTNAYIDYHKY